MAASTSNEFNVPDDVIDLVREVIAENNWGPVLDIRYSRGSKMGDGYASKHVAVEIKTRTDTFNLFVKYAVKFNMPDDVPIGKLYSNEVYFYEIVYPAYLRFLSGKKISEDVFRNVPKLYGTSTENTIALEDLKSKGYNLFDRKRCMDEKHINLVLKTFAKFHALSFSFKDQDKEGYNKLVENWDGDFIGSAGKDSLVVKIYMDMIRDGISKLDPVKDKDILDKCNADDIINSVPDAFKHTNEYSILVQGDCHNNNIMFLYENEDRDCPKDIMLVDWQALRSSSPAFDISYFFYGIANEEALSKLNYYLDVYYIELSDRIKQIGSDPDILYPRNVFEREWRNYCKYGFASAFTIIKFMLVNDDEVPVTSEIDYKNLEGSDVVQYFTKYDGEAEFLRRIRILCRFMIDNDYL